MVKPSASSSVLWSLSYSRITSINYIFRSLGQPLLIHNGLFTTNWLVIRYFLTHRKKAITDPIKEKYLHHYPLSGVHSVSADSYNKRGRSNTGCNKKCPKKWWISFFVNKTLNKNLRTTMLWRYWDIFLKGIFWQW